MDKKFKKILILCKGDSVTGGSELIHQFCHELNSLNKQSFVCYYPFEKQYNIPQEYLIYNVTKSRLVDSEDTLIILPEVATKYAWSIKKSGVGIWWLSIDNYYRKKGDNLLKDKIKYFKDLLRFRLMPISLMRNFLHFAQSQYAYLHLDKLKLNPQFLSDYLNPIHFNETLMAKEDIILYNPVKGRTITDSLIKKYRSLKFIPLEKLDSQQVRDLFRRAKLYIDFGNHPGKDRMPREAVMSDCCIITGVRGSAYNDVDIPIPNQYKLDDNQVCRDELFYQLVNDIFRNFDQHVMSFSPYKDKIKIEKKIFQDQVKSIFSDLLYG